MTRLTPSAHRAVEHACSRDEECAGIMPGHALPLIQERVASASPSRWRDAIVWRIGEDGWVDIATLDDERISVWHHADLGATIRVGDPVALHGLYHVLASGRARLNVLVADLAP